ncbi:MAG: GIY-YIG nuclease family protein [Cyclobacteriaceae bacterium]|nr:GIY-YIG nuclease family protein [Cyclobacteriaceae bacterium]
MIWFFYMTVYILYSIKVDRYYVGQTEDLAVRLNQHNNKELPYSYSKISDDCFLPLLTPLLYLFR